MTLIDTRPPSLDVQFRPGNTLEVTLDWPDGTLTSRTFAAALDAAALTVSINDDVMTVSATAAQTTTAGTGSHDFTLTETTGGAADDVIVGRWAGSNSASAATSATVTVTESGGAASIEIGAVGGEAFNAHTHDPDAHQPLPALARFRAEAARARTGTSGQTTGTYIAFIGDSLTEAFSPTKRGLRWIDHLARRLNGSKMAKHHYVPITANTFSSTTPADWPGEQCPWTYSGTITGLATYGADLHAASIASGGFAELQYFGDVCNIVYVRTPTGPSAAAVTLDGAAQTAINANGAELVGQQAVVGTLGAYGAHTLRVTATGAPLVLEGAVVADGMGFGFGVPLGAIATFCWGHAGFQTSHFTANSNWATSVANLITSAGTLYGSLIGIVLGANDLGASVPAATYQANLVTMVGQIDAALAAAAVSARPGILFIQWPNLPDTYVDAAWNAATQIGVSRAGVVDLGAYLPAGDFPADMLVGGAHPNDAGQLWVANTIGDFIDRQSTFAAPSTPLEGPIIEAASPATFRSSWTESLGVTGGQVYDATPNDSTQRERRHRIWLDAGTYAARIRYEQRTASGGTLQTLIGHTSCGTVSTAGTDGTISETQLGTTVVIDSPGAYPITIRKTTAAGLVRFVRLHLRRI